MFYPLVDFPTGDVNKNLGTGRTHFFLPLWLGKQLGLYTVYGGGGYWYVFAAGKQDVDARAKPAHDDRSVCNPSCGLVGRAQEFSPDSPARKRGLQNVSETNKLSGYLGYQITF